MRGTTHAAIGMVAPLWVSAHSEDVLPCLVMSLVAAGTSLGPDIDSPRSTVSNAMPRAMHKAVVAASEKIRKKTSTGKDLQDAGWRSSRGHSPDHRALTHTGLSAVAVGALLAAVGTTSVGVGVLCAASAYVLGRLLKKSKAFSALLVGSGLAMGLWVPVDPVLLGVAAGLGWLSHIIADGCTTAGVPLMWPARINGKKWWRVRFLGSSLESGSQREYVVGAALIVLLSVPLLRQLFVE